MFLLLIAAHVFAPLLAVAAPPTPPMILYGQLWQDGVPIAAGAEVFFDVAGAELVAPVIDSGLGYSFYSLEIPNRALSDPGKEEIIRIVRIGDSDLQAHQEVYRPGFTVAHHLDTQAALPPQNLKLSAAGIERVGETLQLSCRFAWDATAEIAGPETFSVQWFVPAEEPDLPAPIGGGEELKLSAGMMSLLTVADTEVASNRLYLVIIPIFDQGRKGQAVFNIVSVPLGAEGEI